MIHKQYKTILNAPRERVWEILWGKDTYPKWTAAFCEGSKVETTWQEGAKVLFLNGENEGMISRIEEKTENEKMVFRHLGMVDKNGNEDVESEAVKSWAGAEEIYLLKDLNGKTELSVGIDITEDHQDFFDNTWPKVFIDLKHLVEN